MRIEKGDQFNDILPLEKIIQYNKWIKHNEFSKLRQTTNKLQLINKVHLTSKSLYQSRAILHHLLPFKSSPLVIILDQDFSTEKLNFTSLKEGNFQNCTVIYVLTKTDYLNENINKLRGFTQFQVRLMERLGFKVIILTWLKIRSFKTNTGLRNYLKSIIENS